MTDAIVFIKSWIILGRRNHYLSNHIECAGLTKHIFWFQIKIYPEEGLPDLPLYLSVFKTYCWIHGGNQSHITPPPPHHKDVVYNMFATPKSINHFCDWSSLRLGDADELLDLSLMLRKQLADFCVDVQTPVDWDEHEFWRCWCWTTSRINVFSGNHAELDLARFEQATKALNDQYIEYVPE